MNLAYFVLSTPTARANAAAAMQTLPLGAVVIAREATRSLEQNSRLWALLSDIARQVEWPVDGYLRKLDPEEWKHVLTAGLRQEQRIAQGINGGFVVMPQRTSKMSKRELSDLMTLIECFGAERGVVWGDEAVAA